MHPFATTYAWTQRPGQERFRRQDAPPPPPRRRRALALIRAVLTNLGGVPPVAARLVRRAAPRPVRTAQRWTWPALVARGWGSARGGGLSPSPSPATALAPVPAILPSPSSEAFASMPGPSPDSSTATSPAS